MSDSSYDIVTVGGGIAGSSLALAMAAKGARVLVRDKVLAAPPHPLYFAKYQPEVDGGKFSNK